MSVEITHFVTSGPDDVTDLGRALHDAQAGGFAPRAIIAKTEGTATINDFSRALARRAIEDCVADRVGREDSVQIILSTGCEGVITPGGYLLSESTSGGIPGLAIGVARSQPLPASSMITMAHSQAAEAVVAQAIAAAGIDTGDVALVLMKSPVLTRLAASDLPSRQRELANSTALSRGVAALGIAAALGDIDPRELTDAAIGRRGDLYCRRAMVFSGTETQCCEAIVLGNRPGFPIAVRTGIVRDLIDIDGMATIIAPDSQHPIEAARQAAESGRVRAAFLKGGIAPDGRVRGQRTTAFSSDLDPDKHMRAAASGVLAALLGDTRSFISGGAEHQAPPGSGVFTVVMAG
jgi:cyanuric acid amidohydrolase